MKLKESVMSSLKKLNISVDESQYEFLDTTPELHDPILVGLGGSYAYGTNIETSDVDIRGVALHSAQDILLGRGFEQVCNEPTDTTIYSLKKLVSLLENCNPNTIEMLGLKPEHYLYASTFGSELLKNAAMFLSNKCVGSFMGYANQQMYRLQQKTLVAMPEEELNAHVVKTLNGMRSTLEEQHNMTGVEVRLKDGQIVLDLDIKDYPAESLSAVLNTLNTTIREYNKNSKRNEHALAHGKIAKHSMHLLRLYMMCEDLLLDGKIVTYREKEHDLLMDIRNGKYLGEDGKPTKAFFDMVHDYESRLEYAKEHSVLPPKPDYKRIDDFLTTVNYSILCSNNTEKEKPYGFYTSTRR
ncbi:MAG: nucleotidyltransferase domain-containing protein [Bacteroidaceae bacterium]|nr:nucleotidyltransferase domain-containing protein [Bacteroidaceae bacterium]